MGTPLSIGQLLLGAADLPGVSSVASSVASAVAESAVQGKIPWSALDYSGQVITGISGSAIGGQGGGDTAGLVPFSSFGYSGQVITSISGSAIGGQGGGGGDTAGLVPFSSFGYQDTAISSISSSAVYDPSAHARIDELSSNAVSYTSFEYNTSNNITAVNGSAIGVNLSETPLIIDGNTMSAAVSSDGIHIGMIGAQVKIVSNSSQATAANIVYVVTG